MDMSRRQQVRGANRVIGERIRAGRTLAGMSQTTLAAALGVSFQQVQKYEKGAAAPAVGASELAAIRSEMAATFAAIDTAVEGLESARGSFLAAGDRVAHAAEPFPSLLKQIDHALHGFTSDDPLTQSEADKLHGQIHCLAGLIATEPEIVEVTRAECA